MGWGVNGGGGSGRAWAAVFCILLMLAGCQSPPRSARFTNADFDHMAAAMAQSLLASDAVQSRGPRSSKWLVSINEVRNLSSDVITPAEQWSIMYRIQDAQPIQMLWDKKNIRFVLPPEKVRALRERGFDAGKPIASEREVTHSMTATFRSATRAPDATGRTELYYGQFKLMDLRTGRAVWADRVEFKRFAKGHIWD